jgi:hypothetical protein
VTHLADGHLPVSCNSRFLSQELSALGRLKVGWFLDCVNAFSFAAYIYVVRSNSKVSDSFSHTIIIQKI